MTKKDRELIIELISILKTKVSTEKPYRYAFCKKVDTSNIVVDCIKCYTKHPNISVGIPIRMNGRFYDVQNILYLPKKDLYIVIGQPHIYDNLPHNIEHILNLGEFD